MSQMNFPTFKYIGRKRRVKEDRRFVMGKGRFVADIVPAGTLHVALVASPHPAARIVRIDVKAAEALPGVVKAFAGADIKADMNSMQHGVDAPNIDWRPLAVDRVRYAGEWVCAVVATSRAIAEDAAELVVVDYETTPFVIDPEEAYRPGSALVHPAHGSNILFEREFVWGPVADDFARADAVERYQVYWGRSSTVPIETFGVTARWNPGDETLDVWASVQMPKYQEQIAGALRLPANAVRVHFDVDVGGSYGVKRGLKQAVLTGSLARKLSRPVRLIEDRLDNMTGGDAHGPDRRFDVELAYANDGRVLSMKLRALDDCGCYPGRSPLQLGKPVGAIVGPYTIGSVAYHAISVATNKTSQVAVRGFGQAPTNYALETGIDRIARKLGIDPVEMRLRNLIPSNAFPYRIPSGSDYDSGDYQTVVKLALEKASYASLIAERDRLRSEGRIAGIGMITCLEPGGGNSAFEPLFNPKNDTTTWMEGCTVKVDLSGAIVCLMGTTTAGQGHESLVSLVVGETLEREPDGIRVIRSDSMSAVPSNSPVASRMAIMLGGAATKAAEIIRDKLIAIAAHNLGAEPSALAYADGDVSVADDPSRRMTWSELVTIAHRKFHLLPPGMDPGLQATNVMEVPLGGTLPTADGVVQMYPCYAFETHIALVEIDGETGKTTIRDYTIGHDCGVVINPDIVRGMIFGGVAHGIGAALMEEFAYDAASGQLLAGSFMDYVMPSAHETPTVKLVEYCTPSPHTSHGQKGAGEAGYLGAPACIACAVNDALAPLGKAAMQLPMRPSALEALIADARGLT